MDTRQLNAFRAVGECSSITRAAGRLGYSQSAVTAQIQALEAALGARLFERQPDGVHLTTRGEQFHPYAMRILRLVEEAQAACAHADAGCEVTLGASEFVATYVLPDVMEYLSRVEPRVRVSVRSFPEGMESLVAALRTGEVSVAVAPALDPPPAHEAVRLYTEDAVLVAAPDHPLTGPAGEPGALADSRMLVTRPACVFATLLHRAAERDSAGEPAPALQFGTLEAVKKAMVAGLGVACLPRTSVQDIVAAGEAITLPSPERIRVPVIAFWHGAPGEEAVATRRVVEILTKATSTLPDRIPAPAAPRSARVPG